MGACCCCMLVHAITFCGFVWYPRIFALTPRWYQGRGRRHAKGKSSEVGMGGVMSCMSFCRVYWCAGAYKNTLAHMESYYQCREYLFLIYVWTNTGMDVHAVFTQFTEVAWQWCKRGSAIVKIPWAKWAKRFGHAGVWTWIPNDSKRCDSENYGHELFRKIYSTPY